MIGVRFWDDHLNCARYDLDIDMPISLADTSVTSPHDLRSSSEEATKATAMGRDRTHQA
jgi:hypothetical protein